MVAGLFLVLLIASLTQAVYNEDCTGAQIGKQCSFDCTKVIYCDDNGNNYTLGICGQDEMCVDGQCKSKTADPPPVCAPKPAGPFTLPFKCSDVGVFPNIMSCDRFYFCTERGQTPSQECVCGVGEVFDYEKSRCEEEVPSITTQCKKTFCDKGVGTCGGLPDNDDTPKYAYVCIEDSGYVVPLVYMPFCNGGYTSNQCKCSSGYGKKFGMSPLSTPTCAQYNASRFSSTPATTTTEAGTESWRTTSMEDKTEPTTKTKPATTTTSSSSSSPPPTTTTTAKTTTTTAKTTTTTQGSAGPPPPPPPSSGSTLSYSLFYYMVLIVVYLWNLSCGTL